MKHIRYSAAELIKKLAVPIPNELIEAAKVRRKGWRDRQNSAGIPSPQDNWQAYGYYLRSQD
jgi:hypothetical protein